MIALTHLLFGLALAHLLRLPVAWATIGAVLPDVDILLDSAFPFTHRGILHTPLAAGFVTLVLVTATRRDAPGAALGLGYLSHLFLDTFTYSGIMWLYPLRAEHTLGLVGYDSIPFNAGAALLSAFAAILWSSRREVIGWIR